MIFDPMHYLLLLEQKVGALDQAPPLRGWNLPLEFATLHRLLEARVSEGKASATQTAAIKIGWRFTSCFFGSSAKILRAFVKNASKRP